MQLSDYANRFSCIELDRHDGILTVRLHSKGGPLVWSGRPHRQLAEMWTAVAADRENRVIVLTGTGDTFIGLGDLQQLTGPLVRGEVGVGQWDDAMHEGMRLITQMLAVDVPIICAVNGPAQAHSELAVLSDIVLAAEHAYFQDHPHVPSGLVPGDGMHVVWPMLIGINRARYFLMTGEAIDATEAQRLGVVAEVLPAGELLDRAYELARGIASRNPMLVRNTRHALVRPLRKAMADDLQLGLALECIAALSGRDTHAI